MYAFKIVTTVLLGIIITTMLGVVIAKCKESQDRDTVVIAGIITAIQIMAIASAWL